MEVEIEVLSLHAKTRPILLKIAAGRITKTLTNTIMVPTKIEAIELEIMEEGQRVICQTADSVTVYCITRYHGDR